MALCRRELARRPPALAPIDGEIDLASDGASAISQASQGCIFQRMPLHDDGMLDFIIAPAMPARDQRIERCPELRA